MKDKFIEEIFDDLKKRKNSNNKKSYTAYLINNPGLLGKKIGEESTELIIDFIKNNQKGIVNESADLIYHLLVVWLTADINPKDVWDELSSRKLKTGFEEKNSRSLNNE